MNQAMTRLLRQMILMYSLLYQLFIDDLPGQKSPGKKTIVL